MSQLYPIDPRSACASWTFVDMRDEEDVGAVIVLPMFGPDHLAGLDCWCHPQTDGWTIVHNAQN